MEKLGRNDLCHCGSGKKYKNCHMNIESSGRGWNKAFVVATILVVLAGIGIVGYVTNTQKNAEAQGGYTPAPPPKGEAPPGKVWSYEHGHWHDAF